MSSLNISTKGLFRESRRNSSNSGDLIDAVGEIFEEYTSSSKATSAALQHVKSCTPRSSFSGGNSPRKRAVFPKETDLARVYELWQQAKAQLKQKTVEIARLKDQSGRSQVEARLSRLNAAENDSLTKEAANLRVKLARSSELLDKARAENSRWSRSYESLKNELRISRDLNERQRRDIGKSDSIVNMLESKIESMDTERSRLVSEALRDAQEQEDDVHSLRLNLSRLEERVKLLTGELHAANVRRDEVEISREELRQQVQHHKVELDQARDRIKEQEQELLNESRLTARIESKDLEIRLEHLRVDNARLLALLRQSSECKVLADHCRDVGKLDGVTWLAPTNSGIGESHLCSLSTLDQSQTNGRGSSCHERCKVDPGELQALETAYRGILKNTDKPIPSLEHENWVPMEAIRIANIFCRKHSTRSKAPSMGDLYQLLRNINLVWHRRDRRLLKEQRARHARAISEIHRKSKHSESYEQVMRRSKSARHKNAAINAVCPPKAVHESALQRSTASAYLVQIEDLNYQIRTLKAENSRLRRENLEQSSVVANIGIQDMQTEASNLLEEISARMRTSLKKVDSMDPTEPDHAVIVKRTYCALMESLEDIIADLKDIFQSRSTRTPSQEFYKF